MEHPRTARRPGATVRAAGRSGVRHAPATIRDVALRAGVSTATVSRVLAGIGHPRPETAAAVRAAAGALDYRPSGVARSLRMRRTRSIGLVITDIQNPFFPEVVQGADLAARSLGYTILLGSAAYDETRTLHYLDLMADRRVDGIIVSTSQVSEASWQRLLASPVPVVVVNAEPGGVPLTVITSDNEGGARLVGRHLAELGHRRIALVRGRSSYTADEPRNRGVRTALRAAGIADAEIVEVRGSGDFEGGERAVRELLERGAEVTAIACYNDITAIGALRALRAAGLRVPADVSVVGFDDIDAASWVVPALTTVAQRKAEMGRLAVERLVALLDDPDGAGIPGTILLPMELRVRESTAPPRSGRPGR